MVAITHRALWFVLALLPFVWPQRACLREPLLLIFIVGLSDMLGQASTAPWLSWMADLLPPDRAGRFWGVRQRVLAVFLIVSSLLYGWLLDAGNRAPHPLLGFTWVFVLTGLFGVADIVVHIRVIEPKPTPPRPGQSLALADCWRWL